MFQPEPGVVFDLGPARPNQHPASPCDVPRVLVHGLSKCFVLDETAPGSSKSQLDFPLQDLVVGIGTLSPVAPQDASSPDDEMRPATFRPPHRRINRELVLAAIYPPRLSRPAIQVDGQDVTAAVWAQHHERSGHPSVVNDNVSWRSQFGHALRMTFGFTQLANVTRPAHCYRLVGRGTRFPYPIGASAPQNGHSGFDVTASAFIRPRPPS